MYKIQSEIIDSNTKFRVLSNTKLYRYLVNEKFFLNNDFINLVEKTSEGSVVFSVGDSDNNLILLSGVHGNELSSQVALLKFLKEIYMDKWILNARLHIVPFLIPIATAKNTRSYNGLDMNRNSNIDGPTKSIVDYAVNINAKALCDCHSTDPSLKPGINSVFCSFRPEKTSYYIARHISTETNSKLLPLGQAGTVLEGAVEDECNIRGVPAVTCETQSVNCEVSKDSVDVSYKQILSFLNYFKVLKSK